MKIVKRMIAGAALMLLSQQVWTQSGIDFFHGSYAEAQMKAEDEGKLIFMDAYATWCGPCKYMTRDVFPDSRLGALFNASFVSLKMDMEKGEGPRLARILRLRAYPTLFVMDAEGKVLEKVEGAMGAEQLLAWAGEALEKHGGLVPEPAPPTTNDLQEEIDPADDNNSHGDAGMGDDLEEGEFEDDGDELIGGAAPAYSDHALANLERDLLEAVEARDRKAMLKISANLLETDDAEKYMLFLEIWRYWAVETDQIQDFLINVAAMMEQTPDADAELLNNAAWYVLELTEDEEALHQAADWANQSIALEPDTYYNHDTFAHLMFAAGEMELAKEFAEKALEIARREGDDARGTKELLASIDD